MSLERCYSLLGRHCRHCPPPSAAMSGELISEGQRRSGTSHVAKLTTSSATPRSLLPPPPASIKAKLIKPQLTPSVGGGQLCAGIYSPFSTYSAQLAAAASVAPIHQPEPPRLTRDPLGWSKVGRADHVCVTAARNIENSKLGTDQKLFKTTFYILPESDIWL